MESEKLTKIIKKAYENAKDKWNDKRDENPDMNETEAWDLYEKIYLEETERLVKESESREIVQGEADKIYEKQKAEELYEINDKLIKKDI